MIDAACNQSPFSLITKNPGHVTQVDEAKGQGEQQDTDEHRHLDPVGN